MRASFKIEQSLRKLLRGAIASKRIPSEREGILFLTESLNLLLIDPLNRVFFSGNRTNIFNVVLYQTLRSLLCIRQQLFIGRCLKPHYVFRVYSPSTESIIIFCISFMVSKYSFCSSFVISSFPSFSSASIVSTYCIIYAL